MSVRVDHHIASWMVVPLGVSLQLVGIEVNLAQIPGAVPLHLIVEVPRLRMPAFPSGGYRPGAHFISKLHHRDKAVSAGAVPLLRSRVRPGAERSQRAPGGRSEPHRSARFGIVEGLHDVAGQALKAVDLSPRNLPGAEVGFQLVGGRSQGLQSHIAGYSRRGKLVFISRDVAAVGHLLAPVDRQRGGYRIHAPAQVPRAEHGNLTGKAKSSSPNSRAGLSMPA